MLHLQGLTHWSCSRKCGDPESVRLTLSGSIKFCNSFIKTTNSTKPQMGTIVNFVFVLKWLTLAVIVSIRGFDWKIKTNNNLLNNKIYSQNKLLQNQEVFCFSSKILMLPIDGFVGFEFRNFWQISNKFFFSKIPFLLKKQL